MKKSLHHCFRPNWFELSQIGHFKDEYTEFLKSHKYIQRNFKSNNRRAYYFFLCSYGRDFISTIRFCCKKVPGNTWRAIQSVIKMPWIKLSED